MVKWEVGKQYDRRDGAKVQCIGFCVDGRPVFELLTGLSGGIYATRIDGVHPYCKEQDVLPPLKEEFVGFTVHKGSNTAVIWPGGVPKTHPMQGVDVEIHHDGTFIREIRYKDQVIKVD